MTIRLKIENLDSRENAIVEVRKLDAVSGTSSSSQTFPQLKGGESCEEYVHSGQKLEVVEVQNG